MWGDNETLVFIANESKRSEKKNNNDACTVKPVKSDTCVICFPVLSNYNIFCLFDLFFIMNFTLCNPTSCLFQHKIYLPVHVRFDRLHCIYFRIKEMRKSFVSCYTSTTVGPLQNTL